MLLQLNHCKETSRWDVENVVHRGFLTPDQELEEASEEEAPERVVQDPSKNASYVKPVAHTTSSPMRSLSAGS